MKFEGILSAVTDYYSGKALALGATPAGADWSSGESQRLRFEQLLRVKDVEGAFSINDYGSGYGALCDYLGEQGWEFTYCGFDLSDPMVRLGRELHSASYASFVASESDLPLADYTVASGIFNVRLSTPADHWLQYMLHTLNQMNALSRRGFAFNVLTSYSDSDRMRPDLYYADSLFLFDHCKRNFSRRVALLHDYPLYEFTMLVRK